MKLLITLFFFSLSSAAVYAHKASNEHNVDGLNIKPNSEAQLQLTTNILEARYCSSNLMNIALKLTFKNIGKQALIIDKNSSVVSRYMISKDFKAARERKYTRVVTISHTMLGSGLRLTPPDINSFVTLKSGESHNINVDISLRIYDGTKAADDFLRAGSYALQIKLPTWYYPESANITRQKWREMGFLWSHPVTSLPMSFIIEEKPLISKCSE